MGANGVEVCRTGAVATTLKECCLAARTLSKYIMCPLNKILCPCALRGDTDTKRAAARLPRRNHLWGGGTEPPPAHVPARARQGLAGLSANIPPYQRHQVRATGLQLLLRSRSRRWAGIIQPGLVWLKDTQGKVSPNEDSQSRDGAKHF